MYVRPPKTKYENSKLNGMSPLYICKSPEAESEDVHALYTGTWLRIPFLKSGFSFHEKYFLKKVKKERKVEGKQVSGLKTMHVSWTLYISSAHMNLFRSSNSHKALSSAVFCFLLYYL